MNNLTLTTDKNATFADVAKAWLQTQSHALKPSSLTRREVCIARLAPFFDGVAVRNATHAHCQRWVEGTGLKWSDVDFDKNAVTLTGGEKGTKNHELRTIPMTGASREFLVKLKNCLAPKENDLLSVIKDAKKCLQTTCKKLRFPQFTPPRFPAFLRHNLH